MLAGTTASECSKWCERCAGERQKDIFGTLKLLCSIDSRMEDTMYVVTGATGNTGRVVANRLLDRQKAVRVIGRSKEKLQSLVDRGAEAFVADLGDQAALAQAFAGAEGVYAMI